MSNTREIKAFLMVKLSMLLVDNSCGNLLASQPENSLDFTTFF